MVDYPVDNGRHHLVVFEHGSPLAELDVGSDHKRASLVAVAYHLEQQADLYCFFGHAALRFVCCKSSIIARIEERTNYGF